MKLKKFKLILTMMLTILMASCNVLNNISCKAHEDQSQFFSSDIQSHLFREQLNDNQKDFYDTVLNMLQQNYNSINRLNYTVIKKYNDSIINLDEYQAALSALINDHPEFYWISGFRSQSESNGSSGSISIEAEYYENTQPDGTVNGTNYTYNDFVNAVNEYYNKCIKNIDSENRYKILKSFHDNLCKDIYYSNIANDIIYTAGDVFLKMFGDPNKREAVCEGYAKAFKILCDKARIPCMLVSGTAVSSLETGNHAWNMVQMQNEKWYMVDTTWDDRKKSNMPTSYNYFLCGTDTRMINNSNLKFSEDHIAGRSASADSEYNSYSKPKWPVASTIRYSESSSLFTDDTMKMIAIVGSILLLMIIFSVFSSKKRRQKRRR